MSEIGRVKCKKGLLTSKTEFVSGEYYEYLETPKGYMVFCPNGYCEIFELSKMHDIFTFIVEDESFYDNFGHYLKESFNNESNLNIPSNVKDFSLDDIRYIIDKTVDEMKMETRSNKKRR